ncbi:hypothetical protein B0I22_2437 [Epilithonimonas xixisoli]|uniref:Uncharacterized protein n=1 Tax=Epilithonimonas xixisoli TaxID=1476462 RepID=A0A4R8IBQ0_9FLAO|nr:hypothetical protein B0I22_2437 [Epilithonimonas xixisoli]
MKSVAPTELRIGDNSFYKHFAPTELLLDECQRNEMFVERIIVIKSKLHRSEMFVKNSQYNYLGSVGAKCL